MKKFPSILFVFSLLFMLTACSSSAAPSQESSGQTTSPSSQQDSVSVSNAVLESESTESEQSANNTLIVYARPAISGSVENMEQYDIIFVGYPIWWGEAPRIVSTFMESYDFSGKTIVPFCTSGGSGIGSSASNLERLTSGATWLDGRRLNGSDSQDTVMEWVNSLDLNLAE